MPPVDKIKKRQVDPYTLQVIGDDDNESRYDADGNFKSWWGELMANKA